MWYLQTKVGTFWILDAEAADSEYMLGIDSDVLGKYDAPEKAVEDVRSQETGFLKWDVSPMVREAPPLEGWREGEPEDWR